MSLLGKLTAHMPFFQKPEVSENYFALNIEAEKLTAALWTLEGNKLKILEVAGDSYSGTDDIIKVTDRLLDAVLGEKQIDPQKILFGVPDSWLVDENLKEEHLKFLRKLVKELEITPMAYVSQTHALAHFLEGREGVPTTAILIGLEVKHLTVTVVRAGKLDGAKTAVRSDDLGTDIEKLLLTFTGVEVLPSKILIYGLEENDLEKIKTQLLSFSWMSNLSFLHFPKVGALLHNVLTIGVCFAGASEIKEGVEYLQTEYKTYTEHSSDLLEVAEEKVEEAAFADSFGEPKEEDLGFMVGDVSKKEEVVANENVKEADGPLEIDDFEDELEKTAPLPAKIEHKTLRFIPNRFNNLPVLIGIPLLLIAAYLFFLKAEVKIYVEPKILENDTQVTADPSIKEVNEADKKIPGQIVETDVTGSGNGSASGKKQVGDKAKGTVKIINNSDQSQDFAKGTTITASNGLKFILDLGVNIASTSATSENKSTKTTTVTAVEIGADSNLASGSRFTMSGSSGSQVAVLSEGNFSGGNSKDVIVVSDSDQQKLLAQVASDLRKTAQQKLQEKLPDKKIPEEALTENITKKVFSKNVGDQTSSFTLTLNAHYKGTAFNDADLKTIVSKLVSTNVPTGFNLDLASSETQTEVSKVEKDGRVIFLARFKAKLIPYLDKEIIKKQIMGKSENGAIDAIKEMENVLGAEIKLTPNLPGSLRRLPFLDKNINVEAGFK